MDKETSIAPSNASGIAQAPPSIKNGTHKALPNSEVQAAEWAELLAVPKEFAVEIYHQCEGRDWVDGAGQAITNWRSYVAARWSKERRAVTGRDKRDGSGLSPNVQHIAAQKELDRVERRLKALNDQATQTALGYSYTDAEKAELKELRARRKQLKEALQWQV